MASSPASDQPTIPLFRPYLAPPAALMPRLEAVLYSGQISEGPPVAAFEQQFGAFIGNPRVLSFYSGTAALHTALVLAGVRPGADVISTAMTAEPTNMAILQAGAQPIFADVDPLNGNVTAAAIADALTPGTRAIVVVHYGGIPVPLAEIRALAQARGLPVIEDAAHALGARYGGRLLGSHSEYVMFSLQAIKHMTTVDGGMLACACDEDLPRGRRFRWFGIDRAVPRTEVDVAEIGWKYHMNNVTATIGSVQLEHIAPVLARHIDNGRWFDAALAGGRGYDLCRWEPAAEPSYWFYTVLAHDRPALEARLARAGIAASSVHRRNDLHSVFRASRRELPGLDAYAARALHLPCGWWVDDAARSRIVDALL